MRTAIRILSGVLLFGFVACSFCGGAEPPDAELEAVMARFQKCVDYFEMAEVAKAAQELDAVMKLAPDPATAQRLRDRFGPALLLRMMRQPGLERAREILALAREADRQRLGQADEIEKLLKIAAEGGAGAESATRDLALAGPPAVAVLLDSLRSGAEPRMLHAASRALGIMGNNATLPLAQVLSANDPILRGNVADILGEIGDKRALPRLKRVAEDSEELPTVRERATRALARIAGQDAGGLAPAADFYYDLSLEFYKARNAKTPPAACLWRWAPNQKLTWKEIPPNLWALEMAGEVAREGMSIAPEDPRFIPVLLCVEYALKFRKEPEPGGARDLLALAIGARYQCLALALAMAEGDAEVAVACAEAAGQTGHDSLLPPPEGSSSLAEYPGMTLIRGLTHPDKRLRYTCAAAVARMRPSRDFESSDSVVPVLAAALLEPGKPVLLVISDHEPWRKSIALSLGDAGYAVDEASTGAEALTKLAPLPRAEAILIDGSLADIAPAELCQKLRSGQLTSGIPLIVMPEETDVLSARASLPETVSAIVPKFAPTSQLREALVEALGDRAERPAPQMALVAAQALADIAEGSQVLSLAPAVATLTIAAREQAEDVRLACIEILGRIGSESAYPELLRIYRDPSQSHKLRFAALAAIEGVVKKTGRLPSRDLYDDLTRGVDSEEPELRALCARILGRGIQGPKSSGALLRRYAPSEP